MNWKDPVKPLVLSRSTGDFDVVVLAIAVGALSRVTTKLTNPAWTGMLVGARTVVTQSMQVWLERADGLDGRPRAGRHRLRVLLRSTHGSTGRS